MTAASAYDTTLQERETPRARPGNAGIPWDRSRCWRAETADPLSSPAVPRRARQTFGAALALQAQGLDKRECLRGAGHQACREIRVPEGAARVELAKIGARARVPFGADCARSQGPLREQVRAW